MNEEIQYGILNHMIKIKGGKMYIGDLDDLYQPFFTFFHDDIPNTIVQISDFQLCDHTVTEAEWCAVMGGNSKSNLPKVNISWMDVQEFIRKLNKITSKNFCLPSEAEWEFAARGGMENHVNYLFSGSHILTNIGWYKDNKNYLQPVMQLSCNDLGLYDMSGNVWEWCSDWYCSQYAIGESHFFRENDPVLDPLGPPTGDFRVVRGGAFDSKERDCWVFWREKRVPLTPFYNVGFRLAQH